MPKTVRDFVTPDHAAFAEHVRALLGPDYADVTLKSFPMDGSYSAEVKEKTWTLGYVLLEPTASEVAAVVRSMVDRSRTDARMSLEADLLASRLTAGLCRRRVAVRGTVWRSGGVGPAVCPALTVSVNGKEVGVVRIDPPAGVTWDEAERLVAVEGRVLDLAATYRPFPFEEEP